MRINIYTLIIIIQYCPHRLIIMFLLCIPVVNSQHAAAVPEYCLTIDWSLLISFVYIIGNQKYSKRCFFLKKNDF